MIDFKKPFEDSFFKEVRKTFDPVVEVVNGSRVLVYKERTEDLNEGLTYSDFSLKSLIDADALDLLNPVAPLSRDNLYVADIASTVANNISSNIEPVNDVEPKNTVE